MTPAPRLRRAWLAAAAAAAVAATIATAPLGAAPARAWDVSPRPASRAARHTATDSAFARLVERLSEPGGFFDSDNLISNEASYLHVVGALRHLGVAGGAYIGVGPDQNFSYIARIRPRIAYLIDIRRDNLLQHLLYKALFGMARSRAEFLALLFGRALPTELASDPRAWDARPLAEIIAHLDPAPLPRERLDAQVARIERIVRGYGIPLDDGDLAKIAANHQAFIDGGLDLRFTSLGRAPRSYYPTYRQLVLEKDLTGRPASFLAREEDFQFVKSLQARDLIVPVVGDLAGPHALRAIARHMAERGDRLSAIYTSNVEFYLMREGGNGSGAFARFARNVAALPRDGRSVIIRSYFGSGFSQAHPRNVAGYFSTQMLQPVEFFVQACERGTFATYWDLVTRGLVEDR